jgi:hypothetical protein
MTNFFPDYYQFLLTPDVVDETGVNGITYLGYWSPGPLSNNQLTTNRYQIRRVTVTGNITITEFADGTASFDKIWSARSIYTYSLLK